MPYYRQEVGAGRFPMIDPRVGSRRIAPMHGPQNFGRPRDSFYPVYPFDPQQAPQQFNPYLPGPSSGNGRMTNNLDAMMGHVGTITNGIQVMRQVGALLNLFK